jgi:hypothetical protein
MIEEKDRYRAPAPSASPGSHPFPQETADRKPTQRTSSRNSYTHCYRRLVYLACTFLGPFVYLRSTWGCLPAGPGRRAAVVC